MAQQSLPVEAAVVTATSAIQGGVIGSFMGTLTGDLASSLPTPPPGSANFNPQAIASLQQAQVSPCTHTNCKIVEIDISFAKYKLCQNVKRRRRYLVKLSSDEGGRRGGSAGVGRWPVVVAELGRLDILHRFYGIL